MEKGVNGTRPTACASATRKVDVCGESLMECHSKMLPIAKKYKDSGLRLSCSRGGGISGSREGSELGESGCTNLVWMFQMKGTFIIMWLCIALIVRAVGRLLKQRCARICEQSVRDGPRLSPSQRSRCGTVCDTRAPTYMLERIALIVAHVLLTSNRSPLNLFGASDREIRQDSGTSRRQNFRIVSRKLG